MYYNQAGPNYTVVKPLAILTVATSHYWGGLWWVPTAMALFLFGFSSGFFTGIRYPHKVLIGSFWKSKFYRLVPRLVVINLFLGILFFWQGKPGIFSWHTLVNLPGLSGFLNWFYIKNQSPFGMGLWFFTVLLLFYAVYPVLAAAKEKKYVEQVILIVALVAASWLQFRVKFGYQLWPTAFSFLAGVYFSNRKINLKPWILAGFGAFVFLLVVLFNVKLHNTDYNYYFVLLLSVTAALFFVVWPLPSFVIKVIAWLDAMVLEIYFIHPYLFVHSERYSRLTAFLISLVIILSCAFALSRIGRLVEKWMRK